MSYQQSLITMGLLLILFAGGIVAVGARLVWLGKHTGQGYVSTRYVEEVGGSGGGGGGPAQSYGSGGTEIKPPWQAGEKRWPALR